MFYRRKALRLHAYASTTKIRSGWLCSLLIFTVAAPPAFGQSTPAGDTITNTATISHEVDGVPQPDLTPNVSFIADRAINLNLIEPDGVTTPVTAGQTDAVTRFELTNLSNETLDFGLTLAALTGGTAAHGGTDNFDLSGLQIFVDANDNDAYDSGTDTAQIVEDLAAGETISIFVVGDVPSGALGNDVAGHALTATAYEGGSPGLGAALSESGSNTIGAMDTHFLDGAGTSDASGDAAFSSADDFTVSDQPIDLEITITSDNTAPVIGFDQYTFTVTVTNNGPANASGVTADIPLPTGNALISETSSGSWNSSTGTWTIGPLGIGASEDFTFTVIAGATGSYDGQAEITAADQVDSDSDPAVSFGADDLTDSIADDDESIEVIAATLGTGTVAAQTCSNGTVSLDWSTESWTPTSLTGSFSIAGKPITLTITDSNGAIISSSPYFTPVIAPFYQGGLGSVDESLAIAANDSDLTHNGIRFEFDLGPTAIGVEDFRISLFDIDGRTDFTRIEGITITGELNGVSVTPSLEGGSVVSISGNEARGAGDSPTTGATSGDGTLLIGFDSRVDKVIIDWGNAPGTTATSGQPGFSLHDVSFCQPATGLDAEKAVTAFGGSNPYMLPGNDVIYTITLTNTGEVPTDPDSILLIDAMPGEVEFYNGDHDGTGPETDPVGFAQNGTGITFTYGSDVGYSSSPTRPASFASCTYSPTPPNGYDDNVTFICFNPKGQIESTDPDSDISFSFRARIK